MEHRRFLVPREAARPFAGSGLFDRIGGGATVEALVDGLYDGIKTDAALRPLFGRNLEHERAAQKRFLTEWLGGEGAYSADAYLPLKHRTICCRSPRALAERWLLHFAPRSRWRPDAEARAPSTSVSAPSHWLWSTRATSRRICARDRTVRVCAGPRSSLCHWRDAARCPLWMPCCGARPMSWHQSRTRRHCSSWPSSAGARLWSSCCWNAESTSTSLPRSERSSSSLRWAPPGCAGATTPRRCCSRAAPGKTSSPMPCWVICRDCARISHATRRRHKLTIPR